VPVRKPKKKFSATVEVKALAREQVGRVKATRVEKPKVKRRPKHPDQANPAKQHPDET